MNENDIDSKAETTVEMQDIINDMAPGVPLKDMVVIVERYVRGTEYRMFKVKMPEDKDLCEDIMGKIEKIYIGGPPDNTHDEGDDIEDHFDYDNLEGYEGYFK